VSWIVDPAGMRVPAAGICAMTDPGGAAAAAGMAGGAAGLLVAVAWLAGGELKDVTGTACKGASLNPA
jgi:hypothetical protein